MVLRCWDEEESSSCEKSLDSRSWVSLVERFVTGIGDIVDVHNLNIIVYVVGRIRPRFLQVEGVIMRIVGCVPDPELWAGLPAYVLHRHVHTITSCITYSQTIKWVESDPVWWRNPTGLFVVLRAVPTFFFFFLKPLFITVPTFA